MRILEIGKYYFPYAGGVETHLYSLCNNLSKKGHDVTCIVSNDKNEFKEEVINGVRVLRFPKNLDVLNAPISPKLLLFSSKDFDVVHLHLPNPFSSFYPLIHDCKNLVISYHSDIIKSGIGKALSSIYIRLILNKLLKQATAIITGSPGYVRGSEILKNFKEKVLIVPYGVNPSSFRMGVENKKKLIELRNKYRGKNVLLFVGRFVPYKGIESLIKAMRIVVNENTNVKLLLLGDGSEYEKLKKMVEEFGLNDFIEFKPIFGLKNLLPYYNLCDISILPSITRAEAFGIVQLEAMMCGKPMISTNIKGSGVNFVNKHKKTGIVIEPEKVEELADAIIYLLKNKKLRKKMGANAKKRVLKYFTEEKMTNDILKIYQGFKK